MGTKRLESGWLIHSIQEGKHTSRSLISFPEIRKRPGDEVSKWQFGRGCDYLLPPPDHKDLNKGGGGSFHLFTNHKDAYMWAWRWNDPTQQMEVTTYWHKDGKRFMGPTRIQMLEEAPVAETMARLNAVQIMIRVKLGEDLYIRTVRDWNKMEFGFEFWKEPEQDFGVGASFGYPPAEARVYRDTWSFANMSQSWYFKNRQRQIYPYFGGNQEAPQYMELWEMPDYVD